MTELPIPADRRPDERSGESSQFGLLCLYLVLLAFFILLISMTRLDERRTHDVLNSVLGTFSKDLRALLPPLRDEAVAPAEQAAEILAGELSGLLGVLSQVTVRAEGRDNTVLRLELAPDALFESDSAALSPGGESLLDRVAASLADGRLAKLHVELEALYGVPSLADAVGEDSSPGTSVARSGALVRALAARRLPTDRLGAAVAPGQDGVQLLFRIYGRAPAPLDLTAPDGGRP